MSDERQKIVERIQKLMAKADPEKNPSESEVLECLGMAKRLIEKHAVEEFEWNQKEEKAPEWEFTSARTTEGMRVPNWQKTLGVAVAKIAQTKCILTHDGYDRCMHFYGDKIDVQIALALFKSLSAHGRHLAEQKYVGKTNRNSYLIGFANGVYQKAEEQTKRTRDEANKYALVSLEKKTWLDRKDKEAYPNQGKASAKNANLNPWAVAHGKRDGQSASTTYRDKLTAGG